MLAKEWLKNARTVMDDIENTQIENIQQAATVMADSIAAGRWVHTFGCGHATIPVEEMYPPDRRLCRISSDGRTSAHLFYQYCWSNGRTSVCIPGKGGRLWHSDDEGYTFDSRDCVWIFSHSGINAVNIDVALEAKRQGMKVIAFGSVAGAKGKKTRHSCGKTLFDLADITVDTCAPTGDASVPLKNHVDKIGPVSTMAFVTTVWMTVSTVAEILADRGEKLYIHPSHNVPGDTTAKERLDEALAMYKLRIAGV